MQTVRINGIDVPAGETKALEKGVGYYVPSVSNGRGWVCLAWVGEIPDYEMLHKGLVHLTPDNATAMTNAMLNFEVQNA